MALSCMGGVLWQLESPAIYTHTHEEVIYICLLIYMWGEYRRDIYKEQ
jgi:hypothetical protein